MNWGKRAWEIILVLLGVLLSTAWGKFVWEPHGDYICNWWSDTKRPAIHTEGMTAKSFANQMSKRMLYTIDCTPSAKNITFAQGIYQGGRTWRDVAINALEKNSRHLAYDEDITLRHLLICAKKEPCKLPKWEP